MDQFIQQFLDTFKYDYPITDELKRIMAKEMNDNLELLQELNKLLCGYKRFEKVFNIDNPKEGYEMKKLQTSAFEYLDKWRMEILHKSTTKSLSFYS